MLSSIFLLTPAIIALMAASLPEPPPQQESTNDPAVKHSDPQPQPETAANDTTSVPVWYTHACIPTEVSCKAPRGCALLRDIDTAKRIFCSAVDDGLVSVPDGQPVTIETIPQTDAAFFALLLLQGNLGDEFKVQIPQTAKNCSLKLVNSGSVSSANLECEFEKAATSIYVVDMSIRGEEVRKATKEEQLEQEEEKNTARQGGDQHQKAVKGRRSSLDRRRQRTSFGEHRQRPASRTANNMKR